MLHHRLELLLGKGDLQPYLLRRRCLQHQHRQTVDAFYAVFLRQLYQPCFGRVIDGVKNSAGLLDYRFTDGTAVRMRRHSGGRAVDNQIVAAVQGGKRCNVSRYAEFFLQLLLQRRRFFKRAFPYAERDSGARQRALIGEHTGKLDEVCNALARYYEEEDDLRESIRSAVSYPIVMIVMMFAVVMVLVSKVLPIFAQVFRQLGASVNGVTQVLLSMSETLVRYYMVFVVLLLIAAALFLYFYCTDRGQQNFRDFMAAFPLTRDFSESLALTRFAGGLRMTQSAGLDAYDSLELASRVTGNRNVLKKIHVCRDLLQEGHSFSEAVAKAGLFSPFYSGMISVFAQAGSVDKAMDFIADHYKAETDRRISRALAAIEPTMVVILSLIVGLILLSVMLPLMGIMANIG